MKSDNGTLVQLAEELKRHFPGQLKQVVIFGSRARGDASADSDYDCLLVFDQVTRNIKEELEQLTGRYLLEQGVVLSCIPLTERDLQRFRFEPFLINAQHEGFRL